MKGRRRWTFWGSEISSYFLTDWKWHEKSGQSLSTATHFYHPPVGRWARGQRTLLGNCWIIKSGFNYSEEERTRRARAKFFWRQHPLYSLIILIQLIKWLQLREQSTSQASDRQNTGNPDGGLKAIRLEEEREKGFSLANWIMWRGLGVGERPTVFNQ